MDLDSIPDPVDGQMVEVFPGVFYRYYERENSWIRINGYESIKPASIIEPGLMTKEDFIKIDSLLTSPPKTSLTSEDCGATFQTGVIRLYSRDRSIFVEDYLDLQGGGDTVREQWHVHEDTWGFNFRVNLNFLVEEMKKRGNLISETIVGPKGYPGDRGEPGVDKLDTGPRGESGEDGVNAPFGGGLANTSNLILQDKSRAVVNVDVETVSPDENYLIVHKGVISPEDLCTRVVSAQNQQSTWVLARDNKGIICNDVCPTDCGTTSFIDIEIIVNSIKEHANALILRAKQDNENKAKEWIRTMMKVFNDQKYALCCGLENCRSRKRNQDERRYIESQRIAAAAADFNLIISGSRDGESIPESHTKVELDMDEFKSCEGPGWEPTVVVPVYPNPDPEGKALDLLIVTFVNNVGGVYRGAGNITDAALNIGPYWHQDLAEYDDAVSEYNGKFKAIIYAEGGSGSGYIMSPSAFVDPFQKLENGRPDLIMSVLPFDDTRGARPDEPMFKPEDIVNEGGFFNRADLEKNLAEWYARLEIFRSNFGYQWPANQEPTWVPYFNRYEIPGQPGTIEAAHRGLVANPTSPPGQLSGSIFSSASDFGQLCTTFERYVSEHGGAVWPKKVVFIWDDSKNVGLSPQPNWIRNGINGHSRGGGYIPAGPFHEFKLMVEKYTNLEEIEYKNTRWLKWITKELT